VPAVCVVGCKKASQLSKQGNTVAKMISRQKQKKHSICGREKGAYSNRSSVFWGKVRRVFLSRKEEGRASCVCCGMEEIRSAFEQKGQLSSRATRGKNDSRQKQKKHSICAKENRRIQQAVLADVRVLGEVASLRCVSCACSFCLNILMRLDMTHTDLSHRQHRPSA